ncbi:MAG: tripartite tricarboxylate transporter TctB family protein [Parvibaculaceae bacterium]
MRIAALKGDLGLAALFAALGLVWIVRSLDLPFWAGFAPDSGFLPLVYGVLLLGLSAAVAASLLAGAGEAAQREPLGRPFLVLASLVACVAVAPFTGFVLPLFALMMFLYAYIERLPVLRSLLVAAGTTAVLVLVFEHWLKIPLPLTPWDS